MDPDRLRTPGAAFLLSQLGGHSARRWTVRLAALGLEPREVMLFRSVALAEGRSQQELARSMGLPASRIVGLVDRLEAKGWLERRTHHRDRRTRALFVTPLGRKTLRTIAQVSTEHETDLTRGLSADETADLIALLGKVAGAQGLVEGVHPGFADPAADPTRVVLDDPPGPGTEAG
jgi:DNA-binding MarR family transcriptional regulator